MPFPSGRESFPCTRSSAHPWPTPGLAPATPLPSHLAPYADGEALDEVLSGTAKAAG
jgi:hypothetical protein